MSAFLFVAAAALASTPVTTMSAGQAAFPDPDVFMRQVRDAVRLDYELQRQFTYTEERRDVRISRLGKVEVGPLRTFQVFPSSRPGRTYKRLIAIDGKPLTAGELARRDREHEQHLAERAERERRETPEDRAHRLQEEREELAERNAILDDVLAVFEATFEARDVIDGQDVFVITLTPREHARVTTREGRWLKDFAGRRRIDGAGLPADVIFDASGRTLLFRRFDIDLVTTCSDYTRIQ